MKTKNIFLAAYFMLVALVANGTIAQQVTLKTLALGDFDYKGDQQFAGDFKTFNDMLRTSFTQSRRFTVVERARMAAALQEQGLGETGIINPDSARRVGKMLGADFVAYGSITEAVHTKRMRGPEAEYRFTIDLAVLESETGAVKTAGSVEVTEYGSVQQVLRAAVAEMTARIILDIYPVMIANVATDGVLLNYGEGFIANGQTYQVFAKGNVIKDPATGAVLMFEETPVGLIRISSVDKRFSKGSVVEMQEPFARGMICRPYELKMVDAAPAADFSQGRPRLAIGDFVYSREFNLEQGSGQHAPSRASGFIGAVTHEIMGGARVPASRSGADRAEQHATQMASKSEVLREMVTTRAVRIGQYDVIERARMDELSGELRRAEDGSYDARSIAEIGRLLGAEYMTFGTITRFSNNKVSTGLLVWGQNTVELEMTLEIRLVDVQSGRIKIADTVSASTQADSSRLGALGFGTASEQGGALGELMEILADNIISKITLTLRPILLIGLESADGHAMISYGEGVVNVGDVYAVYQRGAEVRNPYSGEISFEEKEIGRIRVSEVLPRYSKCTVLQGADQISANLANNINMTCRPPASGTRSRATRSSPQGSRSTRPPSRPAF